VKSDNQSKRPERPSWVKDAERTPNGSLIVVEGRDGKLHGYRMPTRSLREGLTDDGEETT
jgi:hypothetical protein